MKAQALKISKLYSVTFSRSASTVQREKIFSVTATVTVHNQTVAQWKKRLYGKGGKGADRPHLS